MNASPSLPSAMYWQIFRKDWRLLWPLALAAAVTQALLAVLLYHAEPYAVSREISALAMLLSLGLAIALALLIVFAVQQDAIPGANQDWLVRPIRRRDLLLAKLLALALLIHGPIVAVQVLKGLVEGFALDQVLRATLLSNFELALLFSLPLMAIAALTKSVGEAIVGALALFLGLLLARLVVVAILFPFTHTFSFSGPADGTGVGWVWQSLSHAVLLLTTIAVLMLQYFRRSTLRSRVVFAGGLLLFMLIPGLPWRPAFAIQHWFAASPDANQPISIAFDPGSQQAAAAGTGLLLTGDSGEENSAVDKSSMRIVLPLRLSGLPAASILHADRSAVRLIGVDGEILYRGIGRVFDLPSASGGDGQALLRQAIEIPAALYTQAADQVLRLELDYSLTLLRSHTLPPLTALSGPRRLPEVGRCASRMDAEGTALEVGCRQPGALPSCISVVLEQPAAARRNPEKFVCDLNYAPALLRFAVNPIDRFETALPFRDPKGSTHYPVDEAQLRGAQVVFTVHKAEDHFTRRVVVPQFRLRDWQAAANER